MFGKTCRTTRDLFATLVLGLCLSAAPHADAQVNTRARTASPPPAAPNDPRAVAVVNGALTRMGGESLLRDIRSVRLDMMTQWKRTNFTEHPFGDYPSYERNVELRDYTRSQWRNTRDFNGGMSGVVIVDDSVCSMTLLRPNVPAVTTPLNVAYRDERRELFLFAPERMLLVARDAGGLRLLSDTTIAGVVHARIATTIEEFPATYFVRRNDSLPAMVRFRADETNDFGLAPWGMMEVEFWFSGWTTVAPGVLLPRQRDVVRVGKTYKRMTVQSMVVNPPTPTDSFTIADSTRVGFFATQNQPMWDAPLDALKIEANDFVAFPPQTGSSGAVRIGGSWVMMETGQAAGAAARLNDWLLQQSPRTNVAAGFASYSNTSNGGILWFAQHNLPVYAPGAAAPMHQRILGKQRSSVSAIAGAQWTRIGTDSVWVEPLLIPDNSTMLAVYSPTHKWLYIAASGSPLVAAQQADVTARLLMRGMPVEWVGSSRQIRTPARK